MFAFNVLATLSRIHRYAPSSVMDVSPATFIFVPGARNISNGTSTWEIAPHFSALIWFPIFVNSLRHSLLLVIFPCANILYCRSTIQRILVFTSCNSGALALVKYPRNALMIPYICFYRVHWLVNRACKRLASPLIISMNYSANAGV